MSQNSGLHPLISLIKPCSSKKKEEEKFKKSSMKTITNPTCLWVVRKNLTSIMKVLLVGFCGL